MNYTQEEIETHNRLAMENRARRRALPIVGSCKCCNSGMVREWPTGALECDNPRCAIMGASLDEFTPERHPHMRVDVLQLTREEIDSLKEVERGLLRDV